MKLFLFLSGTVTRRLRLVLPGPLLLLGACKTVVLHPSGDVAVQERDLLLLSTGLMLLIIIPVMALTIWFAWRYRASNTNARYEPDWDHSTQLELVIWACPLLIIMWLGALTWMGSHLLDPYRPLDRIDFSHAMPQNAKPLEVDVVALDWKWLFIYPQYGIATLNQLAAPVNREINFRITASSVMNSFYIPALAGQIYAMPGMETKLHAVMNETGSFRGFSANYSGAGFSGMHFAFESMTDTDFNRWVAKTKTVTTELDKPHYLELRRPSQNEPIRQYGSVEPGLYNAILNMCAEPGKMCMSDMAAIDSNGGMGLLGITNIYPLEHDEQSQFAPVVSPDKLYVASICATRPAPSDTYQWPASVIAGSPLVGASLSPP